ncbi:hypothetical protein [Paenibacillus medicaginis]|uniref:DNA mismatch repair protein n=1 Tax=Paenibacillus medicaginis TaxID=1470560 RepID=A0ABV5BZG3_9BACL
MSDIQEIVCSTTKQKVIEVGLEFLHGAGADHICKVCIAGGGSCCLGCLSLKQVVGCQKRNTSCTAWLCGFLKYIFYEVGLIQEWKQFWDQVPGQDYREDFTPPYFPVLKWLDKPNIRFLSEAFAEDLQELRPYNNAFWLIEIKETLDRHIDSLMECSDPKIKRKIEKKIKYLTKDFRRFHLASEQLV